MDDLAQACTAIIAIVQSHKGNNTILRTVELRPGREGDALWIAKCESLTAGGDDIADAVAALYHRWEGIVKDHVGLKNAALALPVPDWIIKDTPKEGEKS